MYCDDCKKDEKCETCGGPLDDSLIEDFLRGLKMKEIIHIILELMRARKQLKG